MKTAGIAANAVTAAKVDADVATQAELDTVQSNVVTVQSDVDANEVVTTAAETKASTALTAILTSYGTTNTVKTAGIADDAVTAAKLAANSVVSASITDGTIVTADISIGSVTLSNLDSVASSTLTRVEAKVDSLALFTTSTGAAISASGNGNDIAATALKAIDASNAKANAAALGDVETRVDVVEANGGNTILGFIKRLFGSS